MDRSKIFGSRISSDTPIVANHPAKTVVKQQNKQK